MKFWTSVSIVVVAVLAALVVPALADLDQRLVDLDLVLQPPSWQHLFGTDALGRDVLLRCVYGMRVSLLVGLAAGVCSSLIGTAAGALAGTWGGRVDQLVCRVIDGTSAVPQLLLGILLVALFRPSVTAVVVAVALTHWMVTARIVRVEVMSLRARPFVDAAISGGASRSWVLARHFLPNVFPHAALATTLMVPHAIWHESALSFLGLGLPPHLASLGTMMDDGRRALFSGAWWVSLAPGLFILIPTLAVSGLAGVLRDRVEHRRRSAELAW
ncbi:ABC transporter permease [Kutzneria viridogrisea]|uniref:Peptide/nickel transport system permease protein n=1 Tax=Kutzneria viridogrisea TaxID=47990 RepID=A0ABR6BTY6_9PSEU|nr:peptide/nickel transport system permease protein [Kutzneria viridogrisea]